MNIQPQLLPLNKLLAGRLFRIPQYQRAYSWTSKQRRELFADIRKTHARSGSSHFMATIVGLRRETRSIKTDEFHVVEVVDGQQRLTTLAILLRAVAGMLTDATEIERATKQELLSLLVKSDELAPVLLQTNHDSSEHCLTYLRTGAHPPASSATTVADRRLLDAIEECESFASECIDGMGLVELVALLKNRLVFILHEIDDESLVYTVFEVLNSRGLDVSWVDRLKSALMGAAFEADDGNAAETINELHRIWRRVYECVGLRQGLSTEALRFAATLRTKTRPNRALGEQEAVEVLRAAAGGTARGIIEISDWVYRVTTAVDRLHADERRMGVIDIAQARLLAVSALIRSDLLDGDLLRILKAWESASFRIFGIARKDSRSKVGDYVRLAWDTAHSRLPADDVIENIRLLSREFPVEQVVDQLYDVDCYDGWQSYLRYFFFRYEEYLARRNGQNFDNEQWGRIWADTAARSIEHIMPQSLGSDSRTDDGIFVHRLGNLVLLPPGLNSRLGNRLPAEKAPEYIKTGLAIAADVAQRIPVWDRAAVIKRESELLEWARSEWRG